MNRAVDVLKRVGGPAGVLMALSGAGIVYFIPDRAVYGWIVFGVGLGLVLVAAFLNSEDLINVVKGRPFRYGANAVFYSLFFLMIVAGADFLAARHKHRFDLTEQGVHSLSPQTIKILQSLDQDVTVVAFYSSRVAGGRQNAEDLLDEYKYQSPRLSARIVDPLRSPAEARTYAIETDGTVVVSSKTGEARITSITEEDLTNAIVKATAKSKKVICASTGHGEKKIDDDGPEGFHQATEAMRKENFEVREVKLFEGQGVPPDCSSLIVVSPKHALLAPEADAVGAYVKGSGRLLVLREPRQTTGLEQMLEPYGVKTGNDFIVDPNPVSRLFGGSAAAPVVSEYATHEITKDFQGLATIFPTVSAVEAGKATEPGAIPVPLMHTGAQSWGENGELSERVSFDSGTDKPGPVDIAVAVSQKHPGPTPPPADPNAPAPAAAADEPPETRLVVFGDSDFAANGALLIAGNKDLFLNTIAWLNQQSDLISIRPKTNSPQPIILSSLQARLLTGFWLLSPLLMLTVGVGVYLRRRRL